MQTFSKRQTDLPASARQTTKRTAAAQGKCKPRTKQKPSVPPGGGWNSSAWNTRPGSENRQEQANSNTASGITYPLSTSMSSTVLTSEKNKSATLGLRPAKDVPIPPNFGNDYSDAFLHQGILPQSWVQNAHDVFEGYPKLKLLHELKQQQFQRYATPQIGIRCSEHQIVSAIQGMVDQHMQFDAIMVHGCIDPFPFKKLQSLPLEALSPRPSLLFLWVPANKIAQGRDLMDKWGFRKGEDITYVVGSSSSAHAPTTNTWGCEESVFRPTTWHCLMGLKGTVRRSTNTELIHCNVDTDVIFETPKQRRNVVPEYIYTLVENFTSMSRKIHILSEKSSIMLPVRPRAGWVILSPDTFSVGTLEPARYHEPQTIPVSREIDALRPQTPPLTR